MEAYKHPYSSFHQYVIIWKGILYFIPTSLAIIALKLKEAFGLDDVNKLPIVYNIAWYEQKAVIVLLALLAFGVKNIHLGPTLPAFLSPNVANVLVETFGIGGISNVDSGLNIMGLIK